MSGSASNMTSLDQLCTTPDDKLEIILGSYHHMLQWLLVPMKNLGHRIEYSRPYVTSQVERSKQADVTVSLYRKQTPTAGLLSGFK